MQVSSEVQRAYDDQYDTSTIAWRTLGAKDKAKNIVDLAQKINFSTVLEVGAGEGSILEWLSKWNFCDLMHAIDISESGVQIINDKQIKGLQSVQLFDGYKIPFPDAHFDLVICSHVMEHVEHERILLREIKRVSKYQIFEVPIDFSPYVDRKIVHYLSYGHINVYTPSLFRFLLKSEQFSILTDACHLYSNAVLKTVHKGNFAGFVKVWAKNIILRAIPYLKGIKPHAYTVLTESKDRSLQIF